MRALVCAIVLTAAVDAAALQLPRQLADALVKSGLTTDVAAWCRAEFEPVPSGAFAVAVVSVQGSRYAAIHADGRVIHLGDFKGRADLSCYSAAEAKRLDESIRQSVTIEGGITPRFDTTVICGFIDETTAECWQYDPSARTFLTVGGWTT